MPHRSFLAPELPRLVEPFREETTEIGEMGCFWGGVERSTGVFHAFDTALGKNWQVAASFGDPRTMRLCEAQWSIQCDRCSSQLCLLSTSIVCGVESIPHTAASWQSLRRSQLFLPPLGKKRKLQHSKPQFTLSCVYLFPSTRKVGRHLSPLSAVWSDSDRGTIDRDWPMCLV
jgi:hypothetical protein